MSTERTMNYRRVLRALRERKELEDVLGVRSGESIVDAAKRLRDRVSGVIESEPEAPKEKPVPQETIATIQVVGDDREHLAGILHCLAERIRLEGTFDYREGQTFAFVRLFKDTGENVVDPGTFWGVGYAENFPGEEIAYFANKDLAVRFSQGKNVFDENEGLVPPGSDSLCVVRACLIGTIWNSTEADPHGGA